MEITERLYRGSYCALDEGIPQTGKYLAAKQRRYEIYKELEVQLTESQRKLLEQIMDTMAEENDYVLLGLFRQGLQLGISLLTELH